MSRMMKLRIALGNAILPNVPQAMDITCIILYACRLKKRVGNPVKVTRGVVQRATNKAICRTAATKY